VLRLIPSSVPAVVTLPSRSSRTTNESLFVLTCFLLSEGSSVEFNVVMETAESLGVATTARTQGRNGPTFRRDQHPDLADVLVAALDGLMLRETMVDDIDRTRRLIAKIEMRTAILNAQSGEKGTHESITD
jgi:hypothetical protein